MASTMEAERNELKSNVTCKNCGSGEVTAKRHMGRAIWTWCICLLLLTGICFWIPFTID